MQLQHHAMLVLAMMCGMASCTRSISLVDRQCPCLTGWVCDQKTNTCIVQSDASTPTDAADAADADTSDKPDVDISTRKRVFVSSVKYTGDMGGIVGATALCNELAQDAGLSGMQDVGPSDDWLAFISIPTDQAIDRIADVGPWYLVNQTTLVANNKAQLVAADFTPLLAHAINMTEDGNLLECNEGDLGVFYNECGVWTGVYASGEAHPVKNCEEWTVATSVGGESGLGLVGNAHFPHAGWLNEGAHSDCASLRRIYCFEQ